MVYRKTTVLIGDSLQYKSRNMFRIISAAFIGNALEIYDMVIYGLFASAIAKNFFPQQDKLTGLASTFAIFLLVISPVH